MGRRRTERNSDLPPYLYRYRDAQGRIRFQLELIDKTRITLPPGVSPHIAKMQATNYNIRYRDTSAIFDRIRDDGHAKKPTGSRFNVPLSDAIQIVDKEVVREELSDGYLQKYRSTMVKLESELGGVLTRNLNLELVNEFLEEHYQSTSAKNFNNILAHIKKLASYLADKTYILDNFMRNKKNRKITRSEGKKTRQPLTMEDFMAIHDAAPTFLKVAMRLAFETTHAVKEITRIKHTIPRPKEGVCGIVWNDKRQPMHINGIEVYGTLYIHRQKSRNHDSSRVAIPVTRGIYETIELAKTDRLVCPYAVRRRPRQSQRGTAKGNDHPFQLDSQYLSKAFSRVRDEVGVKANLPKAERPTFHEIRGLSAREFERRGYNPSARMAHSNTKTTEIYTKPAELTWVEVEPLDIWENNCEVRVPAPYR
ncbi:integrase [Vibrio maritimus]|uniref:integrase n=1 Tax=Vibrio maritimus TaxID=990268 RepID=UPI0037360534